jgi:hypothetical protein
MGWTGQLNQGSSGVAELVLIGLVERSSNVAGLLGRLGARGDAGSWSVAAVGGRTVRPASGGSWTLLGEVGLSVLMRADGNQNGLFSWGVDTTTSSDSSVLPYLGVRVLRQLEPGRWLNTVGLFAQQTLGKTRGTTTTTTCFLGCSSTTTTFQDGGFSIGLTAGWATPRRVM